MKNILCAVILLPALLLSAKAEKVYQGVEANSMVSGASVVRFKDFSTIPAFIKFESSQQIPIDEWQDWMTSKFFKTQPHIGFELIGTERDQLGMNHYRYRQTSFGIPIEFGIWIIHEKNGLVTSMNGELFDQVNQAQASLTEAQALEYALQHVHANVYKWELESEEKTLQMEENNASATYFPKGNLTYANADGSLTEIDLKLAWKFNIYAHQPLSRREIYIDANSGNIVFENNLIHHADSTGTAITGYSGQRTIISDYTGSQFRLRESGRGNGVQTFNMNNGTSYAAATDFIDNDNYWNSTNVDQYATDAHWGAEMTYDFYWNHFNRNSINNNGFTLKSYVHYNTNYGNAFWDGQRMTYGDGSNGNTPFTALDIAGHEITHGLTTFTADLIYQNESGALNESFSDIFGAAIEFDALGNSVGDWMMGEDLGFVIRYMNNPGLLGDPDTYLAGQWYTGTNDNGGVHTNSGVQNFWYYLLVTGGSGTNDLGNAYSVAGIGHNDASAIAFRNLTVYLTTTSQYNDARFYAIQSAMDLFGPCSQQVVSTGKAWYAVGVGTPYQSNVDADFFAAATNSCQLPFTVAFNNYSSNATSYAWNFGDGSTSTAANPTHTYTTAGDYTVTLQVSSTCGTDSKIEVDYVQVGPGQPCEIILPASGTAATQTTCEGSLYDNGGPTGNYTDGAQSTITIAPASASSVTLNFALFDVEAGGGSNCIYDYLEVYDGPNTNAPLIGKYCNSNNPPSSLTSTASSITLKFFADGGVTGAGFRIDWDCQLPTSAPEADFTVNSFESCQGTFTFTDMSVNGVSTWLWDFGDGNTSTLQHPTHTYASSGSYNVKLTATNNIGSSTEIKNSFVNVNKPAAPYGDNVEICPGESATLVANGIGEISWYDAPIGGNLIAMGDTFITPSLNSSTAYYVETEILNSPQNVGAVNNSIGGGGNFNSNQYLIFDVSSKIELVSVKVYAGGAGTREIELRNNNGTSLQIAQVNLVNGEQIVPLNFIIEPGNDYQLGISNNSQANMFRNNSGASYPYEIAGVVSITKSSANTDPYGYYYFYYDWEVKDMCISERGLIAASTGQCTGINELDEINFSVYPNPTQGSFYINKETNLPEEMKIFDATGQLVYNQILESNSSLIDLKLARGIYFITLENGGLAKTERLIIQ